MTSKEKAISVLYGIRADNLNLDDAYTKDKYDGLTMGIKALEQEPCEDEYIKVPKKALKYRTKGTVAYNTEWLKNHFDIERAVICGAQEPCGDAISRQEVCKIIDDIRDCISVEGYWAILERLKKLPPVNPTKTGHWIDTGSGQMCSSCGEIQHGYDSFRRFCASCGARMVELQESEETE